MIKGVNKQVVEVLETESEYFERVLFFVNPKFYGMSESKLKEKAQTVLSGAGTPPKLKKYEKFSVRPCILIPLSALVGAVVTAVVLFIIM